jgi:hypothetical protein
MGPRISQLVDITNQCFLLRSNTSCKYKISSMSGGAGVAFGGSDGIVRNLESKTVIDKACYIKVKYG